MGSVTDKLDEAIAGAARPAIAAVQINVTIDSTGRPAALVIPEDLTLDELMELVGWMTTAVAANVRAYQANAGPRSPIEIVRVLPGRPS